MIGIYALYWENQGLVYIGKTTTNNRYSQHLNLLRKDSHYNYKLQKAYNNYGIPVFLTIENTTLDILDTQEIYWIQEFNSIFNGLNIANGGISGKDTEVPASIYSKRDILRVFSLLSKTLHTYTQISLISGVGIRTIQRISRAESHKWLEQKYPNRYANMLRNTTIRKDINSTKGSCNIHKIFPKVLGPTGVVYNIENIKDFCLSQELIGIIGYTAFTAVLRGEKRQYKGYVLLDPKTVTSIIRPKLVGPDGTIYQNITNIKTFCSQHPLLQSVGAGNYLAAVFRGTKPSYLGFKLEKTLA